MNDVSNTQSERSEKKYRYTNSFLLITVFLEIDQEGLLKVEYFISYVHAYKVWETKVKVEIA